MESRGRERRRAQKVDRVEFGGFKKGREQGRGGSFREYTKMWNWTKRGRDGRFR